MSGWAARQERERLPREELVDEDTDETSKEDYEEEPVDEDTDEIREGPIEEPVGKPVMFQLGR